MAIIDVRPSSLQSLGSFSSLAMLARILPLSPHKVKVDVLHFYCVTTLTIV